MGITNSLTICAIFITILSTLYSNYKNDLRINEQIKENETSLFIQLRYDDVNSVLPDLIIFLELTLGLYKQLLKLSKSDSPEKDDYISPKAFLVMQLINITSNKNIITKIPNRLKIKLEKTLIKKVNENNSNELNKINDANNQFNIIISKKRPEKVIKNYIKYNQFLDEFNSAKDIEMHETVFKKYYTCEEIKTEDYYNHFNNIYQEIITSSTEELILKDINSNNKTITFELINKT